MVYVGLILGLVVNSLPAAGNGSRVAAILLDSLFGQRDQTLQHAMRRADQATIEPLPADGAHKLRPPL